MTYAFCTRISGLHYHKYHTVNGRSIVLNFGRRSIRLCGKTKRVYFGATSCSTFRIRSVFRVTQLRRTGHVCFQTINEAHSLRWLTVLQDLESTKTFTGSYVYSVACCRIWGWTIWNCDLRVLLRMRKRYRYICDREINRYAYVRGIGHRPWRRCRQGTTTETRIKTRTRPYAQRETGLWFCRTSGGKNEHPLKSDTYWRRRVARTSIQQCSCVLPGLRRGKKTIDNNRKLPSPHCL